MCILYPHDHYEELCAVAATGQASESELESLKEHLQTCPTCRQMLGDFAQVAAQAMPEVAERHSPVRVPDGMKHRFMARAYSEGLALNNEAIPNPAGWFTLRTLARWSAAAATVILLATGLHFIAPRAERTRQDRSMASPVTAVSTASADNHSSDAGQPSSNSVKRQFDAAEPARDDFKKKLDLAQRALALEKRDSSVLRSRLTVLEGANEDLVKAQSQRHAEIDQLKDELTKLRSDREADRIASMVQETELNNLRNKVVAQSAELSDRHRLTAAAGQVRDLIIARNLHIVDVHDTDEDGKKQKAFGRIFYTEGKSLIFYAYDLAEPKQLNAKISFYVWGEKLGGTQPVKNLGIFHNDDVNDGRWVLTFDDPRVLARINSVFVTVESSKKTVTQPSGKKILYAYLGNKANHP